MTTKQPERAYLIEFTESGNLDQECGGMPFHRSVLARSEGQARLRFAEHMRTEYPGSQFTIQQIGLSVFPSQRPNTIGKQVGCRA